MDGPWEVRISKNTKINKWVVEKPKPPGGVVVQIEGKQKDRPSRDVDQVKWILDRGSDPAVTAHFQFTDLNLFVVGGRLSQDMTAHIGKGEKDLTLKLHKDACRRMTHRYAVWISETNGGDYAVGEDLNPPPEINVGP